MASGHSPRTGLLALFGIVGAILLVPAVSDAQVQQATTPQYKAKPEWFLTQDGRAASPPLNLGPEPALVAACGAKPTKAQCVDASYWKTNACATSPANDAKNKSLRDYCTWVLQKEWIALPGAARPTMFPTSDPTTAFPALTQPRRVERGKSVVHGTTGTATKRGYSKATSPTKASTSTATPRGGSYTPRSVRNVSANGTYATQQMASTIGQQLQIDNKMTSVFDQWGAMSSAQLTNDARQLAEWVMAKPSFVTPGAQVNSCNEYAFKRWGNWSTFQYAAKRMNRNFRNIYKIAMDPESPVFINQDLKQTGTNQPVDLAWKDVLPGETRYTPGPNPRMYNDPFIPPNAFYSIKPDWIDRQTQIPVADRELVKNAYGSRAGTKIRAKSDTSPLGMHREAKTRLDTVYGNPLDEELQDITKRTGAYLELASRRFSLLEKDACTVPSDPCYYCHPRPPIPRAVQEAAKQGAALPANLQKIKDMVTGAPVINPADVEQLFHTGSPIEDARALAAFNLAASGISELSAGLGRGALGGQTVQGGMKQKGIDVFAQVTKPSAPQAPVVPAGPAQMTAFAACVSDMMVQKPAIAYALDQLEKQMTTIVVNEAKNPKGCLQNPGPNTTNMCDWNYQYFAGLVTDAFSDRLERDLETCSGSVGKALAAQNISAFPSQSFNVTVKSAKNQLIVYPCVQRRDFSSSTLEVGEFIRTNGSWIGETCEVERQNQAIKDIQAEWSDYFAGMEWEQGSGKVTDSESNSLTLGDLDALGASFTYVGSWELERTKTQNNTNDSMKGCGYKGAGSMTVGAKILFYGDTFDLMYADGGVKAESNPGRVKHLARWADIENGGKQKYLTPPNTPTGQIDRAFNGDEFLGRFPPPIVLGDEEISFTITIATFPVTITIGFNATASMTFGFAGRSGENCSDPNLKAPTNFRLFSMAVPSVSADAFADASLNYGVASAGARLDLNLLKLSLPMAIDVQNTAPDNWSFRNSGHVGIDMLSGELSAYVSFGVPPAEVTVSTTIMEWEGFHDSFGSFGLNRAVPSGAVRALLAKFVDLGNVSCKPDTITNTACSLLTYAGNPSNPSTAPCPGGGCTGAGGKPEFKRVENKTNEWFLCRLSEHDRNKFTTYKSACGSYVR